MSERIWRKISSLVSTRDPYARSWIVGEWPAVIYAVGDIHGRLDLLRPLEALIVTDAANIGGQKWIVMLGDYVDRGPYSAQVIDHLLGGSPPEFRRICIAGNHETAMLRFIDRPTLNSSWLRIGGLETLASYGLSLAEIRQSRNLWNLIASHIPSEHVEFLRKLPAGVSVADASFVHSTELIPNEQYKSAFLGPDRTIVHGHQVIEKAFSRDKRVNVDTGAYVFGRLTAARMLRSNEVNFLEAVAQNPIVSSSI